MSALIDRLLAAPDISEEMFQELLGHKESIAQGILKEMDRKYLRDLESRLSGRKARGKSKRR